MFSRLKIDYPRIVIGFMFYEAIRLVQNIGAEREAKEITWEMPFAWIGLMVVIFYGGYYLWKNNDTYPRRIDENKSSPFHIDLATAVQGYIILTAYDMFLAVGSTYPSFIVGWDLVAEWVLSSTFVFYGGICYAKRDFVR